MKGDLAFAGMGENVAIYSPAPIIGRDRITIGPHVMIDDSVFIGNHEELSISNQVHIASHASISRRHLRLLRLQGDFLRRRCSDSDRSFLGGLANGAHDPGQLSKSRTGQNCSRSALEPTALL